MEKISTEKAPKAAGPYSQAVRYNKMVFTAGQIAIDPATNKVVEADIFMQTRQVLENLKSVLEASGSSMQRALKVTVYLSDMNNYAIMNDLYAQYFTNNPARSTVQVSRLPKDVLVEMDAVAECD